MVEVLIVTGPLGAGKTTAVNRLLKREAARGGRVAVLINEFGAVSVDGPLVASERPELAGVADLVGGCACCSLREDVVKVLAGWCAQPEEVRPQRIVLETTGLADPSDLVDLELDPELHGKLRVAGVLTVVSALTPLHHLQERGLLRRQVAMASLLHLSKADLDPSAALAWESQVRAAHPALPQARLWNGAAPPDAPDPWTCAAPDGAPEAGAAICDAATRLLRGHGDVLRLIPGKMVVEFQPRHHGKGSAIAAFMEEPPFRGRVPVFLGDDTTDEEGFAEVNRRRGISIRVGPPIGGSAAIYELPSVTAALDWLAGTSAKRRS